MQKVSRKQIRICKVHLEDIQYADGVSAWTTSEKGGGRYLQYIDVKLDKMADTAHNLFTKRD